MQLPHHWIQCSGLQYSFFLLQYYYKHFLLLPSRPDCFGPCPCCQLCDFLVRELNSWFKFGLCRSEKLPFQAIFCVVCNTDQILIYNRSMWWNRYSDGFSNLDSFGVFTLSRIGTEAGTEIGTRTMGANSSISRGVNWNHPHSFIQPICFLFRSRFRPVWIRH